MPPSPLPSITTPAPIVKRAARVGEWRFLPGSALDIGELLGDLVFANAEYVDPTDVARLAITIDVVVAPAHRAAVAAGEDFLGAEVRRWRVAQHLRPEVA